MLYNIINFQLIDIYTLQWFKNSGYKFKFNNKALYLSIFSNNIIMTEWIKNNNYKLSIKYVKKYVKN